MSVSPDRTVTRQRTFSAENLIHAAFLSGDNPILVVESRSRRILAANEAVTRVFGYACDELKGQSTELLHVDEDSFRRFGEMSEQVLSGGQSSYHCYYRLKRRNGEVFDTENLIYLLFDEWNDQMVVVSVIRDLSEPETIPLPSYVGLDFLALSDNLPGALFQCARRPDGAYSYHFFRGNLIRRLGLSPGSAEQDFQSVMGLLYKDDRQRLLNGLERTAETLSVLDLEVSVQTRANEQLWIRGVSQPRRLDDGSTLWDGILFDITPQRQVEEKLHYLYTHDTLTGLANRKSFDDQVNAAIQGCRGEEKILIAILDIEQFHRINELHGFRFGDELIIAVGNRLRQSLPGDCVIARFYGDEFLVMFPAMTGMDEVNDQAHELIAVFDEPFMVSGDRPVSINAKLGMSLFPTDGQSAKALRRRADVALKRARNSVDQRYTYYSRDMTRELMKSADMEEDLRIAIRDGAITPHYQPQYDLKTGCLDGFESLARWYHEDTGWVSPGLFIPLAEHTGQVHAMGELLVNRVLADIREWDRQGLTVPPVAVNFSAYQVRRPNFLQWLRESITTSQVPLDSVTIEITESAFLLDFEESRRVLNELSASGLRLSMDDFGTGFSSLSYLHQLPFNELKIDRSFISEMDADLRKRAVVRGIVELAQALELRVIAEGVENPAQLRILRDMGCDAAQGFLLARPTPAAELTSALKARRPHAVFSELYA